MLAFSKTREITDFSNIVKGKVVYVFKDEGQRDLWQSNEDYRIAAEWINPVKPLYSLVVVNNFLHTANGVRWTAYIINNETVDLNTWNPKETLWKSEVNGYVDFTHALKQSLMVLDVLLSQSIDKMINAQNNQDTKEK